MLALQIVSSGRCVYLGEPRDSHRVCITLPRYDSF
jgi:hypothetical protein